MSAVAGLPLWLATIAMLGVGIGLVLGGRLAAALATRHGRRGSVGL